MALLPLSHLLSLLVLQQATAPAPGHTWIADLKARRSTLGSAELLVEGDVADIRSTSPTAKFGFYRLIDASDPGGLLIRTNELPKEGGALRVRARMTGQQPPDGSLVLDELERARTDQRSSVALLLVILCILAVITLGTLAFRAASAERRYKLAPPLWLLPDTGPYGKTLSTSPSPAAPGPLKFSAELEEQDRQQRDHLRKKRRNLTQLTLGALGLAGIGFVYLLVSGSAAAQVPAFIFIAAHDVPIPVAPAGAAGDTALALRSPGDSARPGFPDTAAREPVATVPPRRRDTTATTRPPRTTPRPVGTRDTSVAAPPVLPVPVPLPLPPPPPPAPPPPAPSPTPVDSLPPPDPAVERSRATAAMAEAVNSLIAAINGRRMNELAVLLPEALAGDLGRRERFVRLVREFEPRAVLGQLQNLTMTESGGEAVFAVNFSWRGDFGVASRKSGRFLGFVRRENTGWRFAGARLLDAVP